MGEIGRNAQCPCGSGMKYKRCCLRREYEVGLDVARAEGVWERMQNWALARRIAESGLGVHRVRDVSAGAWIDLENVLTGARVRVSSPNVSGEAVRWDVLLCRVMASDPTPTLWGGAAFYEPDEEPELLA